MTDYSCFKYRPIDVRLQEQLVNSALYFPQPKQLNDPFDCNVDILQAVDRAISSRGCDEPGLLKAFRKDEAVTSRFTKNVGDLGIGSFSLTANETLLWSHYANNHRGVALRFDFPASFLSNEDEILGVSAVSYEPNPISSWLSENARLYKEDHRSFIIGLLMKVLMSKAPAWKHEQEARIVRPKSGPYAVPREALTHVIFGLHTSEQDQQLVRDLVNRNYSGVRFGRIARTQDDFGIALTES